MSEKREAWRCDCGRSNAPHVDQCPCSVATAKPAPASWTPDAKVDADYDFGARRG